MTMIAERKAANAMGGKTARACDSCLRKRARWFCAADDAFLCQACDASVHSANQLASRHERVALQTASAKSSDSIKSGDGAEPAWHRGFTRKARTPRHNNSKSLLVQQQQLKEKTPYPLLLVPIVNDDGDMAVDDCVQEGACDLDNLPSVFQSDVDLAEFAADVENLLGSELDEDLDVKALGFLESKEEENGEFSLGYEMVKVKDEEDVEAIPGFQFDQTFDVARESLHWNFDDESQAMLEKESDDKVLLASTETRMVNSGSKEEMKANVSLRLNYEAVIAAWASQGCPWTTGSRPELNTNDCWPDCMGACPKGVHHGSLGGRMGGGDGGREARVLRYKEKRRTRLFSKKIRYEVRKLNAEKRPRMKGRFVKRTNFMGTTAAFPYLHK